MCGRYRLSRRKQLIAEYFETESEVDWEPRYNLTLSQDIGIIRQDPSMPNRHFSRARWGLIPSWANDSKIGLSTINARAETVTNRPAFRDAFTSRRCLIPADGFYEWQRSGRRKQSFHFGMHDDSLLAFAGPGTGGQIQLARWLNRAPSQPPLQTQCSQSCTIACQ
jgi:putative SOS response-associated peptidase YedK